jgi:hypothetical protein
MRHRFDQLGKKIGQEALGPSGLTVAHDEIAPDAHHADLRHEPDPTRGTERARLGFLGRMASVLCLIEIYSGTPDEDEALACVGKLIAFRQKRRRDARKKRKQGKQAETFVRPFVWIVTAGRPARVLATLPAVAARGWPSGVYFSGGVPRDDHGVQGLDEVGGLFRVGIVVASELPRDRSTILVRLMAGGSALAGALADLSALPEDAHEQVVASQILLDLKNVLGSKPSQTTSEQEFIVAVQTFWQQARAEGRAEARAGDVLTVLRARGIEVPDAVRERVLAEQDLERLGRWLEKAAVAASVADAIDEPARRRTRGARPRQ